MSTFISEVTKNKPKLVIAVAAAVAAVVLLIIGIVVLSGASAAQTPSQKLSSYFDALIDGDAEGAIEVINPDIPEAERLLLTNEIYAKSKDRINSYKMAEPVVDEFGDETITVKLVEGDSENTRTFSAKKTDEGWVFEPFGLGTVVNVTADFGDTIDVNGVDVDLSGLDIPAASGDTDNPAYFELSAFTGLYGVKVPDTDMYTSEIYFRDDLEIVPTAELSSAVEAAYVEFLDECIAADTTTRSDACPNWVRSADLRVYKDKDVVTGQKWSILDAPTIDQITMTNSKLGTVRFDGTLAHDYSTSYVSQYSNDAPVAKHQEYSIQAPVAFSLDGDTVTLDEGSPTAHDSAFDEN